MHLCPTAPRYDTPVDDWKKAYCSQYRISEKEMHHYGHCPDDILIPYGNYDADVTRRITLFYIDHLEKDVYGLDCWYAFTSSMQQWPAFLEMNCTGIPVDRDRLNDLMDLYAREADKLYSLVRRNVLWPGFNINSHYQLRELLFGTQYNFTKAEGDLRPVGAISLVLTPLYSTDKLPWDRAQAVHGDLAVPTSNARTLSMLATEYGNRYAKNGDMTDKFRRDTLTAIRQTKILRKALSYVLKEAETDSEGNEQERGLSDAGCPAHGRKIRRVRARVRYSSTRHSGVLLQSGNAG
jgi:hypothetical protein